MGRVIVLPTWLSVLSLAVALFVPLGVSLISDTSADAGNRQGVTHGGRAYGGNGRLAPVEARGGVPVEQRRTGSLDHRA